MCWTTYEKYLLSGDETGEIVYSDSKITLHCRLKAHNQSCVRDISFSPASLKFVSCSDDTTARVFDFLTTKEEYEYKGHGSYVKSCHWHPTSCLVATGSQDNNVKLWDPRTGEDVHTMQPHNKTITQVRWNPVNGNWLLTGSQDTSLKVHDIRMMKELNAFQKHDGQITVACWHPHKEELFASASYTG
jgi:polyadenylation factor subunit 2